MLLLGLAACGGGGGPPPVPVTPPPGLSGVATYADLDLGRLLEQEPNDAPPQTFRLPPSGPRTRLEVTGEIGVDAQRFGTVDPVDAFTYEVVVPQDVVVAVDFPETDPVGGGSNDVEVEVRDRATGTVLGQTAGGPAPRATLVALAAGAPVDVVVTCGAGHAWYVLSFVADDPAGPVPVVAAASKPGVVATRAADPCPCAATHVLVRLADGADAAAVAARCGLEPGRRTGTGAWCLRYAAACGRTDALAEARAACARLARDPDVRWAEPDWRVRTLSLPDDAELARQWPLRQTGVPGAWEVTRGDPSIVVGVVDTGVVPHPDLEGQLVAGYDFVSDPDLAGDGNGRDGDPTDVGDHALGAGLSTWHGTHVAALVAGRADDGLGIAGVAPGCRVMPLRAVGVDGGLVSDVADAILFAAGTLTTSDGRRLDSPLRILNLSFGVSTDPQQLREACLVAAERGVFMVGAVGNDQGGPVVYPAAYPTVFGVGAVAGDYDGSGYSNIGLEVDLVAPGGLLQFDERGDGWPDGILSAVLDETVFPPVPGWAPLAGTSQAAPQVAGAAALLLSVEPGLDVNTLGAHLKATALDLGIPGRDDVFGYGLLQVHEALRRVVDAGGMAVVGPPRLAVPTSGLLFEGLATIRRVPIQNHGGGVLSLGAPLAVTDDGGGWLSAVLLPPEPGRTSVDAGWVQVTVDRSMLPLGGRPCGSVLLRSPSGDVLGSVRVLVVVGEFFHAGRRIGVVAREDGTGIARALGVARPSFGYRWSIVDLLPSTYRLQAGEDLDRDGFFCEPYDACGWYGGTSEATAALVELLPDEAIGGLDIDVRAP